MSVSEERLQILQMVQDGQIDAEEASRLLATLEGGVEPVAQPSALGRPNQLRIRVVDLQTGAEKVSLRMPWNLVSVGMNMGARFAREEIDFESLMDAVQSGADGKVMDVVDEESGERVEIFVE